MALLRVLVNGDPHGLPDPRDRGLAYGDGLFETVAIQGGRLLAWDLHRARLAEGLRRLRFPDLDLAVLTDEANALGADTELGVLKLIITRGPSERGYRLPGPAAHPTRVLMLSTWPGYPPGLQDRGVAVCLCRQGWSAQPALAGIKHLNRLEQVLARAEWGDEYEEGLMRDPEGDVLSGTMSNLFLVVDGVLLTPALSHAGVHGVVRSQVCAAAARLQIPLRIQPIPLSLLIQRAEEVFVTNSLIGIWPVCRIEGRAYTPGPVTRKLINELIAQGLAARY